MGRGTTQQIHLINLKNDTSGESVNAAMLLEIPFTDKALHSWAGRFPSEKSLQNGGSDVAVGLLRMFIISGNNDPYIVLS